MKSFIFPVIAFSCALFMSVAGTADASKRTALVIGNAAYKTAPLRNPVNDAEDIAKALEKLDFYVIKKTNAGKREMLDGMDEFYKRLRKSDVGLFYFAGHGMQIHGDNYLIPVGARVTSSSDVEFEAVHAGRFLGKMRDAGNRLNIVILDACRDNPFKRSFRTSSKGLARMDAPKGSIIAYATSPGSVAADGAGRNGIYTKYLLRNITKRELSITEVINQTGIGVIDETESRQIPWMSSTPVPRYYLAGGSIVHETPGYGTGEKGALKVETIPSGAIIFINGRKKDRSPMAIEGLSSGTVEIEARISGYRPEKKMVTIRSERTTRVKLFLEEIPRKARLFVSTEPSDARIRILNISPSYHEGIELEAGRYEIEVSKSGYKTEKQWVDLCAGEDLDIRIDLAPETHVASSTHTATSSAGDTWTDPVTGMEFVWVPGGCYQMGCGSWSNNCYNDQKPVHEVCVDGFWMDRYEVTQGQWKRIMGDNPSYFQKGDNYPVEDVSWNDTKEFIKKLNAKSNGSFKFRLPTEAEWEYACRSGGKPEKYCGGSDVDRLAWYGGNRRDSTHPVGTKKPNGLGIYDMSGNIYEWCEDIYADDAYSKHSRNNPIHTSGGPDRVYRGGSWSCKPRNVGSADRFRYTPGFRPSNLGFRLLRTP